jgi:hypothetical protein
MRLSSARPHARVAVRRSRPRSVSPRARDGSIRWVYLALRCVHDGVLGVYADWKIDYSPSDHLYNQV